MHSTSKELSLALIKKIREKIAKHNAISFYDYMKMALYEPTLGYYSSGFKKIGKDGDFVTAPELGSLFAKTLAHQFMQITHKLNEPMIMEIGAGLGHFAKDVLEYLDDNKALPKRYHILEISADLKNRQKETLHQLPDHIKHRINWLDTPPEDSYDGIIFCNEVVDALPVEVFYYTENNFQRLMVEWDDNFKETWGQFPSSLLEHIHSLNLSPNTNYRSEFIPHLHEWVTSITSKLQSGYVIFIDYGYHRKEYYHPQRASGTLVCHQRHQSNFNPFHQPGMQDITAFVDFTALAEAGEKANLKLHGYTTQANYLIDLGINNLIEPLSEHNQINYHTQIVELKKLLMPNEMGDRFKVMAFSKNYQHPLLGFKNNHAHLL